MSERVPQGAPRVPAEAGVVPDADRVLTAEGSAPPAPPRVRATGGLRTLADPPLPDHGDAGATGASTPPVGSEPSSGTGRWPHPLDEREEQRALETRLRDHDREQHRLEAGLAEVEAQLGHGQVDPGEVEAGPPA